MWFNSFLDLNDKLKRNLFIKYKDPKTIYNLSNNEINKIFNFHLDYSRNFFNSSNSSFDKYENIERQKEKFKLSKTIYNEEKLKKLKESLEFSNIKQINYNDDKYYDNFKNMYDFPYAFYYEGKLYDEKRKKVAIVGSRKATTRGKQIAYDIAYKLAKKDIVIVSGMASGIDTYAHIGALNANGDTIAVLGTGTNVCYPKENINLMNLIKEKGMVISEYYLDTKPLKYNFPKRNRIISAIADFILVVEAEEKSGSLITANIALEYGKDVGAIPGRIDDNNSKGTNALIKEGAYLIRNIDDILEVLQ